MDELASIFLIIALGAVVTAIVGQILIRSGRGLLADEYDDENTSTNVATLVVVFFHLIVLGLVVLLSTLGMSGGTSIEGVLVKFGLVLLVVGMGYGLALAAMVRIRNARRAQRLMEATRDGVPMLPHARPSDRSPRVIEVTPKP